MQSDRIPKSPHPYYHQCSQEGRRKRHTILGTLGATLQKARISAWEARASTKSTSAPASAKACTRHRASSKDTACRASVRATMTMSEPDSFRASTAARIVIKASSLETTLRPFVCPQALGDTCLQFHNHHFAKSERRCSTVSC